MSGNKFKLKNFYSDGGGNAITIASSNTNLTIYYAFLFLANKL